MLRVVVLIGLLGACGCYQSSGFGRDTAEDRADHVDAMADVPAVCGNWIVEPGEECDTGWRRSDTNRDWCRMDCTNPRCGDGVVDTGEWCDDENTTPLDGCEADCLSGCGDGVVGPGEECDDGREGNSDVVADACRSDCRSARCGDGVVDSGEECDDGNLVAGDECTPECILTCGNGLIDPPEECDDGPANSATERDACRPDCRAAHCGDGVVDTGEDCDLLDLSGDTCAMLGHEAGGALRCDATCHLDESWCRHPTCGNGACELGETATGCPADCHDGCGDGSCGETEDQFGCPADCGAVDIAVSLATFDAPHVCVVLADGTVRCWGWNGTGGLGDGTVTDSATPVVVAGLAGAADVEVDGRHSCALLADGTVACWGDGYGSSPAVVPGLAGVLDIAVGSCNAALLSDGTVSCWGTDGPPFYFDSAARTVAVERGPCGLLGDGRVVCGVPGSLASQGVTGATAVAIGGGHSCAAIRDGSLACWGSNELGQLGDGTDDYPDEPVIARGLTEAVAIAAGTYNSCAVRENGTVWCWGLLDSASLGPMFPSGGTHTTVPTMISGLAGAVAVAAGGWDSALTGSAPHAIACAILSDGTGWCWGTNDCGQLGDGTTTTSTVPVQVAAW